jgi:hypothetical protein
MESSLNIQKIVKPSFAVIGIEGSTDDGEGFIPMLWSDANAHFDEVSPVASRDENGALLGIWGAMSDETRSFLPWTDGFARFVPCGRGMSHRRGSAGRVDEVGRAGV